MLFCCVLIAFENLVVFWACVGTSTTTSRNGYLSSEMAWLAEEHWLCGLTFVSTRMDALIFGIVVGNPPVARASARSVGGEVRATNR